MEMIITPNLARTMPRVPRHGCTMDTQLTTTQIMRTRTGMWTIQTRKTLTTTA